MSKRIVLLLCIVVFLLIAIVPSSVFARLGWTFFEFDADGLWLGIDMVSHNEGWAVGNRYVAYYNGIEWDVMGSLSPPGSYGHCIRMVSSTDGWIGGYQGFWRWNGLHWNEVEPVGELPSDYYYIKSIHMLNPSYGWAVGYDSEDAYHHKGITFRWNGYVWDFFEDICEGDLNNVFVLSENNAWVVGNSGQIFNWNGTSWNEVFSHTPKHLKSIHILSVDEGWIVGEDTFQGSASTGVSLHWNGTQWTPIALPSDQHYSLKSVFMLNNDDVWAADSLGYLLHWDGTKWEEVTRTPGSLNGLYDLDFVSVDDGWVIGQDIIGHWAEIDETPPEIKFITQNPLPHNVNYTDTVEINATVADESGVKEVVLCHISSGSSSWINESMTEIESNLYTGTIPPYPDGTTVTFMITAEDNLGNFISTAMLGYDFEYTVIPEFPSSLIPPLFMIATLLAVIVYRRKHST